MEGKSPTLRLAPTTWLLSMNHVIKVPAPKSGSPEELKQGVNCSQKFCGKHGFPNLANTRTSQFVFPKYLMEYQNVKKVKSKFKSEKCNKKKKQHKSDLVLKDNKKKKKRH